MMPYSYMYKFVCQAEENIMYDAILDFLCYVMFEAIVWN